MSLIFPKLIECRNDNILDTLSLKNLLISPVYLFFNVTTTSYIYYIVLNKIYSFQLFIFSFWGVIMRLQDPVRSSRYISIEQGCFMAASGSWSLWAVANLFFFFHFLIYWF